MKTKLMLCLFACPCLMLAGCGISFSGFRAKAQQDEMEKLKKAQERAELNRHVPRIKVSNAPEIAKISDAALRRRYEQSERVCTWCTGTLFALLLRQHS